MFAQPFLPCQAQPCLEGLSTHKTEHSPLSFSLVVDSSLLLIPMLRDLSRLRQMNGRWLIYF